jgi:hypothetical protein
MRARAWAADLRFGAHSAQSLSRPAQEFHSITKVTSFASWRPSVPIL